jgi:hypothetical protein
VATAGTDATDSSLYIPESTTAAARMVRPRREAGIGDILLADDDGMCAHWISLTLWVVHDISCISSAIEAPRGGSEEGTRYRGIEYLPGIAICAYCWAVSVENEIREFLTSRRARVTPEGAGLPKWGRHRRVSGLRRE